MRRTLSFAIVLLAASLRAAAGCGGESGEASTGGAGTTSGSGGSGGSGAGPLDACGQFLACSAQAAPDTLVAAEAGYGADGACFKIQTVAQCLDACSQGTLALHQIHPDATECALCRSDADCSGATPACSPTRGECVECTTAEQCSAPTPACDTATGTCVACGSDADCQSPLPACDPASHTCVACTSDSDCASGKCESDHTCCKAGPNPCVPGACDTHYDSCGKAVACGNCPASEACSTVDGGYCKPISPTFTCKVSGSPGEECQKYKDYCTYFSAGPGSSSAWCSPVPQDCLAQFNCACLAAHFKYTPPKDTCSEGSGPFGAGSLSITVFP